MTHALYTGRVFHRRHIPREHQFSYPFHMWCLDLDDLPSLAPCRPWFGVEKAALSSFRRSDYLGASDVSLADSVRIVMLEKTCHPVEGRVVGLLTMRSLLGYFSPVNFYYGFDKDGHCSHFLAEVANIPWNERRLYCRYLGESIPSKEAAHWQGKKTFKVSPFNPVEQEYVWTISPPTSDAMVLIEVEDERGKVLEARVSLKRTDLSAKAIRQNEMKRPLFTAWIIGRIYLQALKIWLKKIPYIPYTKER